jgi:transcriptional regulator of acetoin/glycerol metabolism
MILSVEPQIRRPQAGSAHADRTALVLDEMVDQGDGAFEMIPSWRRCIAEHHLDANIASAPNILTERELAGRREAFNDVLLLAQQEIDRLYAIVRQVGYVVLLCNTEGIALHHRGNQKMAEQFKYWGVWLGGVVRAD